MMEEENNNNVSSSEETSDELRQSNFESRLSGLLGQIHADDNVNTCAHCGKEGSDVNNECNKCHTVKYCNAACKKKHRKKHKKQCERVVTYKKFAKYNGINPDEQHEKMKQNLKPCNGDNCPRFSKLSNGYCLMCDKKYNVKQGEEEEKDTTLTRGTPCKDDKCTNDAKMGSGYCLSCDRKYNHGGSHYKQNVKQREEEEEDMNMNLCYWCQEDNKGEIFSFGISAYDI